MTANLNELDRMLIGGVWRAGNGTDRIADKDPFTGDTLLEIVEADESDVQAAYSAAVTAQRDWAAALPSERATVMQRAADVMVKRRDEIVDWLIREAGSTRLKANLEWQAAQAVMLAAASMPYMVEGAILPADIPGKECRVYRKPVGVVGVISPWNWPLQLSNRSVAPALAVGNAVVLKPASDTPVSGGILLAKIYEEAGLPSGLLSVVVGSGGRIGSALVKNPAARVISFTGSTSVGRGIAKLAMVEADIIKRVELELGGNGPFVVLDDADLDLAVRAAVFGKFLHQGQICMITNRFIVVDAVYDEFSERFAAAVRHLKVGDPQQPDTMIGPIINPRQFEAVNKLISSARASGARELVGGDPDGLVIPPHVFADVTNDMEIAANEIFGPVAPLIHARDEEDALRTANATTQGLSASVFTRDLARGARFAERMEAGMAHVNDQPVLDLPNNPFGGVKNSGIGRFGGKWAVAAFTTDQWITVQHLPRTYPSDTATQ
ncbi:aldehyde dehydrogenase family protein [Bradyrhizobium sp. ORS 375]|uniref:aldehyde dehydrogenase family protein n=1 Tax=Bradyrhizobium sp. (strain ORS 375) TaxID=566679 RepID=UPI000552193C|nr:aldehyde dehydrogenase family protein [Bradyrhizobium sp. ORS 375]